MRILAAALLAALACPMARAEGGNSNARTAQSSKSAGAAGYLVVAAEGGNSNARTAQSSKSAGAAGYLVVAAEGGNTADEAEFRFRRGQELYKQKRYDEALSEFFVSNRLAKNRKVQFNIGVCLELVGMPNEAFRHYASLVDEGLPEAERKVMDDRMAQLRPKIALVRVETEPAGAEIFVDRKDLGSLGQSPRLLALPPGAHEILVELPGHYPARGNVVAQVGSESTVSVPLHLVYGTVQAAGEPAGAELRLDKADGDVWLSVPGQAKALPGRHEVFVSAPGHTPSRMLVDVLADTVVSVPVKLAALPPPSGALVVKANLDGAQVTIDGEERGFTPTVIQGVRVGEREVAVSYAGRETVKRKVTIKADEREALEVRLRWAQPEVEAASKEKVSARDAPASITVITRDELRAFGYTSLYEALRGVRGIFVTNDYVYPSMGVRGFSPPGDFNNRMLILSNGHSTNDIWAGQGYIGHEFDVDLREVERIEIVRGPGSVLYGTGAFFGVVNVVKSAPAPGWHGSVDGLAGEQGQNDGRVTLSWAGQNASVSVSGAALQKDGERFFPSIDDPTEIARDLDWERAYHADLRARWGGFSLTGSFNARRKSTPILFSYTAFGEPDDFLDERDFAELGYEHTFANGLGFAARAYYDQTVYAADYAGKVAFDGVTELLMSRDTGHGNWFGGEARLRLPPVLGQRLTLGVEAQAQQILDQGFTSGERSRPKVFTGREVLSAYLGDDFTPWPWLSISAGIRADAYLYDDRDRDVTANPRVAVILRPYEGGVTKLLGGTAFRAPSIYECCHRDVPAEGGAVDAPPGKEPHEETVESAEVEHTHALGEDVDLIAGAFLSRVSSLMGTENADPEGLIYYYTNDDGRILAYGGELELRWQPGPGLLLAAQYGLQRTRKIGEPDERIINSPAHTGSVRAMYPLVPGVLTGAAELVYNSSRFDASGGPPVGTMLIWNLSITGAYERWGLRYGVHAVNLLDDRPLLPSGSGEWPSLPQYGRLLRLTVGATF